MLADLYIYYMDTVRNMHACRHEGCRPNSVHSFVATAPPDHVLTRVKLRMQASSLGPMTSHDEQARCLADAVAAVKKNAYFMRKATVRRMLRNWLHALSQRALARVFRVSKTSQTSTQVPCAVSSTVKHVIMQCCWWSSAGWRQPKGCAALRGGAAG